MDTGRQNNRDRKIDDEKLIRCVTCPSSTQIQSNTRSLAEGHNHPCGLMPTSEYGLRPNTMFDHSSWGVAPGYGDKRPSAKRKQFYGARVPQVDNLSRLSTTCLQYCRADVWLFEEVRRSSSR